MVVQDEAHLKRVRWQYMVLDEAQAIKSSSSNRWKTLRGFACRNRLLLSGTPIQNNMAELWALLHFIMPSLFDSQSHFHDWFSKDIEGSAAGGLAVNERQLRRLRGVLNPFMLRRVKADVAAEMVAKHEITIFCDLPPRQQVLYKSTRDKLDVKQLMEGGANTKDSRVPTSVLNQLIQLRKVCNHPQLFEEQIERVSLHFGAGIAALQPAPYLTMERLPFLGSRSHLSVRIPRLIYREGLPGLPSSFTGELDTFRSKWLEHLLFVFDAANVHESLRGAAAPSAFGFAPFLALAPK
eukprot:jgi/Botrbrau1/17161/Bobra.0157s0055.1